jgi:hypothetical protein
MSVPNDAFWSIENPYHPAAWGEGAFEELRLLLPPEHTLLRQVALSGSALLDWEARPQKHEIIAEVGGEAAAPTHFIAAFGPRHGDLRHSAIAVQAEMLEQRRWERQRESDLTMAQAISEDRWATIVKQQGELKALITQFDEWRVYIHELEGELGRPLSGSEADPPTDQGDRTPKQPSAAGREPREHA